MATSSGKKNAERYAFTKLQPRSIHDRIFERGYLLLEDGDSTRAREVTFEFRDHGGAFEQLRVEKGLDETL